MFSPIKMTDPFAQVTFAATPARARTFFGLLGAAAILLSGCAEQKKAAIPWRTAVLVRPIVPQHTAETGVIEPIPDLGLQIPTPAPLATRNSPARPRTVAPPTNQNAAPGKPDTLQIVPELSPQESTSLQRQTDQSFDIAERNLAAAAGKSLNAVQADLASKVRSFVADAHEAGKAGDWARARDLARKAQVLSEELAATL